MKKQEFLQKVQDLLITMCDHVGCAACSLQQYKRKPGSPECKVMHNLSSLIEGLDFAWDFDERMVKANKKRDEDWIGTGVVCSPVDVISIINDLQVKRIK